MHLTETAGYALTHFTPRNCHAFDVSQFDHRKRDHVENKQGKALPVYILYDTWLAMVVCYIRLHQTWNHSGVLHNTSKWAGIPEDEGMHTAHNRKEACLYKTLFNLSLIHI